MDGAKIVSRLAEKHAPTICVVLGTALMAGGTVKAIVEAPAAKEKLDDLDETVHFESDVPIKKYIREKASIILYHYWPTTAMTLVGAALIFWGHKISLGRTAAALAAYQMSKDDLKKLEDKIVELDGEKHLEKAKNSIAADRVNSEVFTDEKVIQTGKGNVLFMDSITGQKFRSDFSAIDRAVNAINAQIHSDSELTASLNDWLDYLGCDSTKVGDKLGWRFTRQGENVSVQYRVINKPGEEVVHLIEYRVEPIWDYDMIESSDRISGYSW